VSWLLFDLHGSVAGICPAGSSTMSDAYRYDGWGNQIASAGSVTNPYRYRGLLNLANDTGAGALLAMGAREYAPQLGTFTQEDSVAGSAANPFTMNRFLYALANPATLVDPDGHMVAGAADDPYYRAILAPPPWEGVVDGGDCNESCIDKLNSLGTSTYSTGGGGGAGTPADSPSALGPPQTVPAPTRSWLDDLYDLLTRKAFWDQYNAEQSEYARLCRQGDRDACKMAEVYSFGGMTAMYGQVQLGLDAAMSIGGAGADAPFTGYQRSRFVMEPDTTITFSGSTNGVRAGMRALEMANGTESWTLEKLLAARGITAPRYDPSNPESVSFWNWASYYYALEAQGTVRAVVGTQIRDDAIWTTIELPTLLNNPNVTRIVTIDPATGAETTILQR
jgi:RHS repeat-associated protein